ncbi:hypothetical protein T4B_12150 [Trichinella pseudospiralis]|uniref:Uncharacterized protein n=1 Tax=Trichinella pseudospiralis TaxID=6337 RepID=A0A0V1IGF2_TRIPS|nr:hypothetical protein T4A_13412 [Trichinella pseudospiralis]KRZ21851.1 hypothetical protein T4B_12150 [Trichinella pseudospiralis]KRZ39070.1 hypothetical protein T4C_10788 [Trichinella pseudospiralis]
MDMENTIVAFNHFGASCLLTAHSLCLRSGTGFTRWDDGCIVTAGRGKEVHSSQGATTTVNGNVHEMMFIVQRMEKRFHSCQFLVQNASKPMHMQSMLVFSFTVAVSQQWPKSSPNSMLVSSSLCVPENHSFMS